MLRREVDEPSFSEDEDYANESLTNTKRKKLCVKSSANEDDELSEVKDEATGDDPDIFGDKAWSKEGRKNTWQKEFDNFNQLIATNEKNLENVDLKFELLGVFECLKLLQEGYPLNKESCELQKKILITFYKMLMHSSPLNILEHDTFDQWMRVVIKITKIDIPIGTQDGLIWWQCKEWSIRVLTRVLKIYTSNDKLSTNSSNWYIDTFYSPVFQTITQILDDYANDEFVSPPVVEHALKYLNAAVLHSNCRKKITREMVELIVEKVIFSVMRYSKEDYNLCQNDPRELTRIWTNNSIVRGISRDLLVNICRDELGMLQRTLVFIVDTLNDLEALPTEIDGILNIMGSLSPVLMGDPKFKEKLESIFVKYIFPLFDHPHATLRLRAFWMLGIFVKLEFKDSTVTIESIIHSALRRVLRDEEELPVQSEILICLAKLFLSRARTREILRPKVQALTRKLVEIISSTTWPAMWLIQVIFLKYGPISSLVAITVEITNHLAQTLHKLLDVIDADGDENEKNERVLAIKQMIDTILQILSTMRDSNEAKVGMAPIVEKIVFKIFEQSKCKLYDEAANLLSMMNNFAIFPELRRIFKTLCNVPKRDGLDYLPIVMPSIHCYITYYPQTFLSNDIETLFDMCQNVLALAVPGIKLDQIEIECCAAKLLEVVLFQFKDQLNEHWISSFVELAMIRLRRACCIEELRAQLLNIIIAALYNDHLSVVNIFKKLEQKRRYQSRYAFLSSFIEQFVKYQAYDTSHDMRMKVIGFCTLIRLPADERPPILVENLKKIVASFTFTAQLLKLNSSGPMDSHKKTYLEEFDTAIDTSDGWVYELDLFNDTIEFIKQNDPEWFRKLVVPLESDPRIFFECLAIKKDEACVTSNDTLV